MNMARLPPLGLIAGPTASGKSALALSVAERIGGTIVNADASQVYRDLRILTARPTPEDEARVPHRLFGHVDASVAHNAAAWATEARAAIAAVHAAGGVPIVVGGTGLYIETLLLGLAPVPAIDPAIRAAVRAIPVAEAYAALAREDAAAALRLRATDTTRIARALEVVRSTGRSIANWQEERTGGIADEVSLSPLVMMPSSATLAASINARFEAMIDAGAMEEVEALLARGLDAALPAMRAIGRRELSAWRRGDCDRDQAIAAAQTASRRYAKRQRTWFRHRGKDWNVSDAKDANLATLLLAEQLTR
jgi:tRNA dimethylallyltransferase